MRTRKERAYETVRTEIVKIKTAMEAHHGIQLERLRHRRNPSRGKLWFDFCSHRGLANRIRLHSATTRFLAAQISTPCHLIDNHGLADQAISPGSCEQLDLVQLFQTGGVGTCIGKGCCL